MIVIEVIITLVCSLSSRNLAMRSALVVGCLVLILIGTARPAEACRGGIGRGSNRLGAAMLSMGMAQMRMIAAQEQYAAAQRAEAHRQHVATYTNLHEQQLAEREARRQARLAGQSSSAAESTASAAARSISR
jgi:hypothetical protein